MIKDIQTLLKVVDNSSEIVNRAKGSHSISNNWFKNVAKSVRNYKILKQEVNFE